MTTQPKPPSPAHQTRKHYVTVEEAVFLLNTSERTIRRMIKDKKFKVLRLDRCVRIDLDDINEYNARKPHEPHPILARLQTMQGQIDGLISQLDALQQQVESLAVGQPSVSGAILPSPQLVPLPSVQLSAAEKRGYPPGTQRLVDFASTHQVTVGSIKSLSNAGEIALSVYQRTTNPERNKQEWWITSEQHTALANYWHEHELPFTACPTCAAAREANEIKEA